MIQNYLAEPLVKNYTAPKYPIFIALQNCLNSLNNKKFVRDVKPDIAALVQKIGPEGEKFVITSLIQSLQFPDLRQKSNSQVALFLAQILKEYAGSYNFLSYFPQIISKFSKQLKIPNLITNLSQDLKLQTPTKISIALSLYLSDREELISEGESELCKHLKELMKSDKGIDLTNTILQELLFQISRSPQLSLKLQEQYNYLLQISQKNSELTETKLYSFMKCDWQLFATESNQNNQDIKYLTAFKKVDYLKQLGPYITFQPELLKNILNQIGNLNQDQIFQCLVMMTDERIKPDTGTQRFVTQYMHSNNRKNGKFQELKKLLASDFNSKKSNGTWNVQVFVNVCNQLYPTLKWQNVFSSFDRPKLIINSEQHFLNLMKAFQKTRKTGPKWKVPENTYFKKWNNLYSQSLFLINVFSCKDPDSLFLNELQNKKIQKSARDAPTFKQIWGYIDMVQVLVQISDYRYISIRELFEGPIAKCPDILIQTLSQIRPSRGQAMLDELVSNLLPPYLQNHSTCVKILENIWQSNPDIIISCISQIYKSEGKKQNSFNLSRVLDVTQSIKDSLIPFTTWNDYDFSIPLAVIAGKRQFLNFQPWISDRIEKLANPFVRSMLLYIQIYLLRSIKVMGATGHKETILEKAQLTVELLNKIFYTIMSKMKRQDISARNFELLKRTFKQTCDSFPQIAESQIPDEVELQTQRQIHKIYNGQLPIKDAIQKFKKLKNSTRHQDQQQFASHITFLCSELAFQHTYPQNLMSITLQLYAALINANLLEHKIYVMLMTTIQEGLKDETNGMKYYFSLKLMEKLQNKLAEEPWFCQKLIFIDNLMRNNPQSVDAIVRMSPIYKILSEEKKKRIADAIKKKNTPPQPTISVVIPQDDQILVQGPKKVEQNDYQILVLLDQSRNIDIPDKQTKISKINMNCNTLSINNVEEKSKQIKKIIDGDADIINLVAHNIVFKRISITTQNNGVQIFYRLVEKLPLIEKPVLKITYKILKAWFGLKGKSINDKKLLNFKNIGAWLGKLTIGKGMPIPIHKLNLRKILIESYTNMNRLNMNVPVIIKILQYIHTHPEIFRITSPWLSRIIGTLTEIQDKLKDDNMTPTKNQIKAFFKSINMKLQNFQAGQTSFLTLNNSSSTTNRIIISELDKYIKIDPQLERKYLPQKIDLKMLITRAVDDSIQQIVEPVIDRAVKIAKVTTKQLISKDFSYQPDPQRFRQSSYKLVKQMAGPLAQVTCREPLKASMNRSLKNMLLVSLTDANQIQAIIQKAIGDNLDLGCTLIKQAVIQSAEEVIKKDPAINDAIQQRISAKMQGIMFKNEGIQLQIPPIVPQQLRPRPGGLSAQQFQVYSQFKKQRNYTSSDRTQQKSGAQKIIDVINQKGSIKVIKQLLQNDFFSKQEVLAKIHLCFNLQTSDELDYEYYIEVCEAIKEYVDPKQAWKSFKQTVDLKRKQIQSAVRRLANKKYFPQNAVNELVDKSNEQETKIIRQFQKWIKTAHQGIQPFLRDLQQMFNKSQNQIKIFFSYSLTFAMEKVQKSYSPIHASYDTNYIENYTKLIIISYKTIASNNCSLYLEHTIQAIIDVFNKLQSSSAQFSYQRPFFKLFTNLICDVTRKQYDIDHEKVLTFYCVLAKQLQKIGPISCPGFTCAWMELICNKNFMPALLQRYEYWDLYYHLLCGLLKFVRQYITEENLMSKEPHCAYYQSFYYAVLKLIIVIVHDFPDFLSEFSLQLALVTGPKFIQLNNMIISAYPKQMKFESPLKVDKRDDLVTQCSKGGYPKYFKLKFDKPSMDFYLQNDSRESSYKQKLWHEDQQTIQLLVLYASWKTESEGDEAKYTKKLADSMKKIPEIINSSNQQTKVKLINSILNLIRYPNAITLFFIDLILNEIIFNKAMKDNTTRQLALNCIIGRMNAEGPQAWGQIYLALQLQIHAKELSTLNVSTKILEQL